MLEKSSNLNKFARIYGEFVLIQVFLGLPELHQKSIEILVK
jgi:hypothetical protein